MLSTKNLNPQQLSALTAAIISAPICIGSFIIEKSWWFALITLLVVFAGSYALILFTLQKFIYRKIKLIYKLIYQTKATKREEFYYNNILPQKGIDEVRQDVEEWAEQRTQEIEKLQANEMFRKEFLQNISHELKTPIFAIQGYVETLLGGAIHNNEVNEKFLTNTARNVNRLVTLLDDLDEISKLESGEIKLNESNFIIQDLINEVFEDAELKAKEKNINCFVKKDSLFPTMVFADKQKIKQVLVNFIDNALKYGKQNGSIEASVYNVDGKKTLIEISDDGYGITEEHLPRIFERFYRTDEARSRKAGGSGLGLAICKHIIEAHGQNIHVRSKLDVGTSFGFTLLAKKEQP
jgi:two-component system, OmpR family, phosphate regulon sensor histidine kinase PhoR